MSDYELDVSGRIANIATLLAGQQQWDRSISMLNLASDVSKRDWRPLVRLAVVQLKLKQFEELHSNMITIERMIMEDSLKMELMDYEYEAYMKLLGQVQRQRPKLPLLSLPSDILFVVLDHVRHPADFWVEDAHSLAQTCPRANSLCKEYFKKLYNSCAQMILSHPNRESLLRVMNRIRADTSEEVHYGIRRIIQDNLKNCPSLQKLFSEGIPRKGLQIYSDIELLPEFTLAELEKMPLSNVASWSRTVRLLAAALMRMERLPSSAPDKPEIQAALALLSRAEACFGIDLIPVDELIRPNEHNLPSRSLPVCDFCPGDESIAIGKSKFGGFGDFPVEWIEEFNTIPRLVVQINFEDVPQHFLSRAQLPHHGILYVLSDSSHYDPAGNAYVRYWSGPLISRQHQLRRLAPTLPESDEKKPWWEQYEEKVHNTTFRHTPDSSPYALAVMNTSVNKGYLIGDCFVWRVGNLRFVEALSFPETGYDDHVVSVGISDVWDALRIVRRGDRSKPPHRLLGYSTPFQRTYESIFQKGCDSVVLRKMLKKVHGIDVEPLYREEDYHHFCKRENRLCNRRMLLELETDWNAGLMWGDSGIMYVFSDQENLDRRKLGPDQSGFLIEFDWT